MGEEGCKAIGRDWVGMRLLTQRLLEYKLNYITTIFLKGNWVGNLMFRAVFKGTKVTVLNFFNFVTNWFQT